MTSVVMNGDDQYDQCDDQCGVDQYDQCDDQYGGDQCGVDQYDNDQYEDQFLTRITLEINYGHNGCNHNQ